jgi:hypothetical protein
VESSFPGTPIPVKEATRLKSWLLSSISGVIVFLLVASGLTQEPAERLSYREGEFWQFKYRSWGWPPLFSDSTRLIDGVYEIVYSQNQFRTFYLSPEGKEELSPPNTKIMYLLDPGRDVQFPLTLGKKWSYGYKQLVWLGEGAGTHTETWYRTVQLIVQTRESVTTEAGTYSAFKVVKADRQNVSSGAAVTTYYFSPDTRSVVRMFGIELGDTVRARGRIEILLIKHGVAGATPGIEVLREGATDN